MSKSSILSLWWIIDSIMLFERTEKTRSPKLVLKAVDMVVSGTAQGIMWLSLEK